MNIRIVNKRRFWSLILLLGIVSALTLTVPAQIGSSTVIGTVSDPQGNAVAGATVTLKNAGKNFSRSTTTGSNGAYGFTAIPPDVYSIEIESKGFKKSVSTNVKASVDTTSTFACRRAVCRV